MRGIDTSSTATSGRCDCVDSSAATPSSASATTSMSDLAVDQHLQPRADDAVVVGDQDADHPGTLSVIDVPPPGAERTSSSPPTSRARSAIPTRPSPPAAPPTPPS